MTKVGVYGGKTLTAYSSLPYKTLLGTDESQATELLISLQSNPELYDHCARVSKFSVLIAREMELPAKRQEEIRIAGLFHDVGKLSIPVGMLQKANLSSREWEIIKTHCRLGKDVMEKSVFLSRYSSWTLYHHERFDGKGYPEGLTGEQIPIETRIISVADSLDAMISHRTYRKNSYSIIETVYEIKRHAGVIYDPRVTEVLERICSKNLPSLLLCLL